MSWYADFATSNLLTYLMRYLVKMGKRSKILNYERPDMEFVLVEAEQGFVISDEIENVDKDEEVEF